ncbi:MAG: glutamine-hydrolyzing carbamoyl-phosphate synthase small subunit [Chloroflexota bacterium]|nr:glutamine-hydrolyzing carbamoyl-phosphate synthase small subunit [Chloroflexota bacterium]
MSEEKQGMLVLEDGSVFVGHSMGAEGEWVGEVVFDTAVTGYQEVITDPSCWGQMIVFTCPHIGNVGVNFEDVESKQPYARAVIARKICAQPSNWRAKQSLPEYLSEAGVPALSGVDTRRLTLTLREEGIMRGALSTVNLDGERLLKMAQNAPDMSVLSPVDEVSLSEETVWTQKLPRKWIKYVDYGGGSHKGTPHVVVVDCGVKYNILRHLATLGARVTVVPANSTAEAILAQEPDGVLISNGPGDPEQVPEETMIAIRELMGKVPIFGICLGQHLIALAAGARIFKLPFGHHGGNHPVQNLKTGEVAITSQNHNYAVDPDSLEDLPLEVTHINLYDGTVQGIRHREWPVYAVQYHPENSPGPHDSLYVLEDFVASLCEKEPAAS